MPTAGLPKPQAALVDRNGLPTREWYSYFLQLRDGGGLTPAQQQQLEELAARVTALEDGGTGGGSIQGIGSIITQGAPPGIVQITLEGDTDEPGNTWYYGTGPDGARGWYSLADGFAVTTDLTKVVDGTTGVTTFGLADLANSGIGAALVKITRDAKGRVSGTAAATTSDLTEGSNLYFTAARVLATVLTGLSIATNAAITAADTALSALGKLQAQITGLGTSKADKAAFTDYISGSGLRMKWISGTSFSVSPGACYVPSLGYVLDFPATITKSGLSLSANTWYHAYGFLSGTARDIEFVSTVPAAPYSGDARTKTGDTSRRYIGSLRTDASGNLISFEHVGDSIKYTNNVINNIVLNAGNATTATTVDVSIYCPVTSRLADALCYNSASSASGAFVFFSNSEAIAVSSSTYLAASAPTAYLAVGLLMDSAQKITYIYNASPGGGGAFVRVMGYKFAR